MLKLYKNLKAQDWVLVILIVSITVAQVYFTMELTDKIADIVEGSSVRVVDYGVVPVYPVSPNVTQFALVGFLLGNTLTENGTVSRGVCEVDAQGMLMQVTERTKIEKRAECAAYLEEDGSTWRPLPFDTIVSMNCWGFTPDIFADLEAEFRKFYAENTANLLKAEFYLPFAVQAQKDRGLCDIRVYPTEAVWQGVTYAEDKPRVKAAIRALTDAGEYPADLWAD